MKIEDKPVRELLDLTGKSAIVTGATLGIGFAIARRLGEAGAKVLITGRNAETLERALQQLTHKGYFAKAILSDVSKEEDVHSMFEYAVEHLGGVDILVNNAGVYPLTPFLEMDPVQWDNVLNINLKGTFLCCQNAARKMVAQKRGGTIINISSINGVRPSSINNAHYDASKGGVDSLTRSLALELGPHNIRVVAVSPGMVWTDGARTATKHFGIPEEEVKKGTSIKIPRGCFGDPDDVARVVLFLASEASAHITGTSIVVDGGCLCYW